MRYIDADALLAKQETIELPDPYGGEYHIDIIHAYDVRNAPTADVVAVVRCKDCAWYNIFNECCTNTRGIFLCKPDGYCNYGERREE